jgi:hypothetical protein
MLSEGQARGLDQTIQCVGRWMGGRVACHCNRLSSNYILPNQPVRTHAPRSPPANRHTPHPDANQLHLPLHHQKRSVKYLAPQTTSVGDLRAIEKAIIQAVRPAFNSQQHKGGYSPLVLPAGLLPSDLPVVRVPEPFMLPRGGTMLRASHAAQHLERQLTRWGGWLAAGGGGHPTADELAGCVADLEYFLRELNAAMAELRAALLGGGGGGGGDRSAWLDVAAPRGHNRLTTGRAAVVAAANLGGSEAADVYDAAAGRPPRRRNGPADRPPVWHRQARGGWQ